MRRFLSRSSSNGVCASSSPTISPNSVESSSLIGASSVGQLEDSLGALGTLDFSADELAEIDRYATESDINLWAGSSSG